MALFVYIYLANDLIHLNNYLRKWTLNKTKKQCKSIVSIVSFLLRENM